MNLRRIDLNLLVAFDALMAEGQVTRAARRLGLSQPAMSGTLARLRTLFGDTLLVRTATGMQPTPRALALAGPVRQVLQQTERLLQNETAFDPATARQTFRGRMSDVLEFLLLPALLPRLEAAPGLSLELLHLAPVGTVAALEADEIDFAVSMVLDHTGAIRAERLIQDRMVCVMAADHPAAQGTLTLERFLALSHLKVSIAPTDGRYVDAALDAIGQARQVTLNLPHWLVVPHLLHGSRLMAVMSERLARGFGDPALAIRELPLDAVPFAWTLYWHRRHDGAASQRWMRGLLRDAAATLG
ncbi:MAG: LysR family transcriptional regulator [Acetobacteraceae bacterium]|nr:LysR family transcriptional regulator [Acetobacteraceae bacterium]